MLPKKVRIGPHTWTVKRPVVVERDADPDDPTEGLCLSSKYEIHIQRDLTGTTEKDTFLHELLHACAATVGIRLPHDYEERFVAGVTPILLLVMQQNPDIDFTEGTETRATKAGTRKAARTHKRRTRR